MSGNLTALAATWGGLAANPTTKKLDVLNATMVAGATTDVDAAVVAAFLSNNGKMVGLRAFVFNTPSTPDVNALLAANYLVALLSGSDGTQIPVASVPGLLTILDGLSADARTGITAGNITAFHNICIPKLPWWQANGFLKPVGVSDLIAAGNLS